MTEQLLDIITMQHLFILVCMLSSGCIGSGCKYIVQNFDFDKSPYELEKPKPKSWDVVGAAIVCRILLGACSGLLVGFVLVDAIKPEAGPFLRLLLFGFIAGYTAPELMKSQEKALYNVIQKQMNKVLKDDEN